MTNTRRIRQTVIAATIAIVGLTATQLDRAGVHATPTPSNRTDTLPYAVLPEIAAWARANHYTGLSPASLAPAGEADPDFDASPYAVLPEIAAWARANHYTGLSPASLAPIAAGSGS
jgi:hypothetical protein